MVKKHAIPVKARKAALLSRQPFGLVVIYQWLSGAVMRSLSPASSTTLRRNCSL